MSSQQPLVTPIIRVKHAHVRNSAFALGHTKTLRRAELPGAVAEKIVLPHLPPQLFRLRLFSSGPPKVEIYLSQDDFFF